MNLVDSLPRTGSPGYWANAYSLWQFQSSTDSQFPTEWLAHTGDGRPVHEWQERVMTNLTDVAPRIAGQTYAEYAAHWVADKVWATGLWDGVFLDVWGDRIYTADSDRWDIDGDGVDELDEDIYGPGNPLDRGLLLAERIMRRRMPSAVLVANGDRSACGGLLDGLAFESFADRLADPDRHLTTEVERYVSKSTSDGLRRPGLNLTINVDRSIQAAPADRLRRARFFLTATLLQNAFWAPMGTNYGQLAYFDELDGAGHGRGYLGRAVEAFPDLATVTRPVTRGTGSLSPGVFRRDFEHGIAIVNTTAETCMIELERPYRRLRGTQDPLVNDGSLAESVTLLPEDGVILLAAR